MAEVETTTTTPAAPPTGAPKRPTGEIPLSWAMPAESVSEAPAAASSGTVVVGVVAAVVAIGLAFAASTTIGQRPAATPAPRGTAGTTTTTTTEVTPPPATAPVPAPPPPAVASPPPAIMPPPPVAAPPAPAPTTAPDRPTADAATEGVPASRLKARALIARARIAARDGDRDRALALAEQAVATDDGCGGCWKTLGLLRRLSGDKAGGAEAKARAQAAADPLP